MVNNLSLNIYFATLLFSGASISKWRDHILGQDAVTNFCPSFFQISLKHDFLRTRTLPPYWLVNLLNRINKVCKFICKERIFKRLWKCIFCSKNVAFLCEKVILQKVHGHYYDKFVPKPTYFKFSLSTPEENQ